MVPNNNCFLFISCFAFGTLSIIHFIFVPEKYGSIIHPKTVRDKVVKNRKSFPKLKNINKIEKKINKVNDNQLKGSLNSLLKAYNERNR